MGELELLAHRGGSRGIGRSFFDRTQHEGERGAELVADVGEKRGLCPIDLREGFGSLTLLLVCVGIGNSRRYLGGDQLEETTILFTQTQASADSCYEQPCELMRRV